MERRIACFIRVILFTVRAQEHQTRRFGTFIIIFLVLLERPTRDYIIIVWYLARTPSKINCGIVSHAYLHTLRFPITLASDKLWSWLAETCADIIGWFWLVGRNLPH